MNEILQKAAALDMLKNDQDGSYVTSQAVMRNSMCQNTQWHDTKLISLDLYVH